ncbi:hypothetical protein KY284_020037 [Solanum tuberosum]|nr:hypothetical protein KY284_020037 [Solanum tuberosum]
MEVVTIQNDGGTMDTGRNHFHKQVQSYNCFSDEQSKQILGLLNRDTKDHHHANMGIYNGKVKGIGRKKGRLMQDNNNLWHMRLGHPSSTVMQKIPEFHKCTSIPPDNGCHICPLAKQVRLQFPINMSKSNFPFQLVHMDL